MSSAYHLASVALFLVLASACSQDKALPSQQKSLAIVGGIGVAECDSYIAQYRSCVETAVPAYQRSQALANIEIKQSRWQQLADTPFKKQALGRLCTQAIKTAREELQDWNCTLVGTTCGNGMVELGEACDDGNTAAGDGCSPSCTVEGSGSGGGASTGGTSSTGGASTGGSSTGGSSTGGGGSGNNGACDSSNSLDIGGPGVTLSVANNSCLKVEDGYPAWWGERNMKLQNEGGGGVPLNFTWSNLCATASGSGSISTNWQTIALGATNATCATYINLQGDGSANIRIKYYSN